MGRKQTTILDRIAAFPIRRFRLVDEASRIIRDMILTGKLPAGTHLRQADLAERLNISRTPLREALMKLEQEGLLNVLPRGFQVVELKLEEAVELYDLREVLDGLAARLAAQRLTDRKLEVLQGHVEKMEYCVARQRAYEWFIHHVAFHEAIYRGSENGRLTTLISTVSLSIQRFHPLLLTTPNRLREAFLEHKKIFKALQARDHDNAERMARLHIANAKEIVMKTIGSGHESYAKLKK